jgi:hypothetical protein
MNKSESREVAKAAVALHLGDEASRRFAAVTLACIHRSTRSRDGKATIEQMIATHKLSPHLQRVNGALVPL